MKITLLHKKLCFAIFAVLFLLKANSFTMDIHASGMESNTGSEADKLEKYNYYDTPAVTLIGTYAESLKLQSDNDHFFRSKIMNPGDVWNSVILIRNDGRKELEFSLVQILNRMKDASLFNVLQLQIIGKDGQILYNGSYGASGYPVTKWISLSPGEEQYLNIVTAFPGICGNEYQAKGFESDWVFEARAKESAAVSDKDNDQKDPSDRGREQEAGSRPTDSKADNGKRNETSPETLSVQEKHYPANREVATGDKTPLIPLLLLLLGSLAVTIVYCALIPDQHQKGGRTDEKSD